MTVAAPSPLRHRPVLVLSNAVFLASLLRSKGQAFLHVPRVFYLLAFAYFVSLLEGKNLSEFEFEEIDIMIDHFNKCIKGRFFDEFPH